MAYRFKKGDKIKMLKNCSGCEEGKVYFFDSRRAGEDLYAANGRAQFGCSCQGNWELVSNSLTLNFMTTLEKFSLVFKSEPEKSFRKTGIVNGDDILTDEGTKIFLGWLLKKNGADFKKEVVDPIIAQDKEDKKC